MKCGVNILNFGPGAAPRELLHWAQLSESLGYHSVMISDHVAITPDVGERYPEPYFDPFTTLAWIAGQTERVQLGTTVCVLPYRHPILMARLTANIDHLSDGRFFFGVGVGNSKNEFNALGAAHQHRGAVSNESLEAIRALWTGEGYVSYRGRFIQFDDVAAILPAQRPHPPIWVGGSTEAALTRTLRYGQAWHPLLRSRLAFDECAQTLQRFADAAGEHAPMFCPRIRLDLQDTVSPADGAPGSGTLDQVRADLRRLEGLGAEHVILDWFTGDLDATRDHDRGWRMLELIAREVLDLARETLR